MFEKIISYIDQAEKILLFPHVSIDGDSAGSCRALCLALRKTGKQCYILADEALPEHIAFLDFDGFILKKPYIPDTVIAVDCGERKRIDNSNPYENRWDVFSACPVKLCIDHHMQGGEPLSDVNITDSGAPAAAVLIYKLLKEMDVSFDREIAEALYTAILTDTGAFRYSNTNGEVHLIISDLYNYGIDHTFICNSVYENKPLKQLKLEHFAFEHAVFLCDGKGCISYVPVSFREEIEAPYSYSESAIDFLRGIKGVEIAACLKEKEKNVWKLSLRSKSYASVRQIALNIRDITGLDGGGHEKAAACTMIMSLGDAVNIIEKEIAKALQ